MPFYDRVKENTSLAGLGSITLSGASGGGFVTFSSVFPVGFNRVRYCVEFPASNEFEVGLGTLTGPSTITRDQCLASSNSNNFVNFTAGLKEVFLTSPGAFYRASCSQGLALAKAQGFISL